MLTNKVAGTRVIEGTGVQRAMTPANIAAPTASSLHGGFIADFAYSRLR